jgi:phage terminase large subunit
VHIAFQATRIFWILFQCLARIIVNRGGTRSSKSYSIAQLFVWRLFNIPGRKMGIGRATMPALRQSVMLDVIGIMKAHDLYDPALIDHNKSTNVITCRATGASITFVSFDEALTQKKRGAGYNDFWFNEGNEVSYDNFKQVNMRLTEPVCGGIPNQIFIDLNPDDAETWVKTKLEDKGRCLTIVSTYKDNPFLSAESVAEIEQLEEDARGSGVSVRRG